MRNDNNIVKALKLLDHFITNGPNLGLNELSRLSGYPKSTLFRLLCSLEDCGFIARCREYDSDRRYKLGVKLLELGMKFQENFQLDKTILPLMKELKNITHEAIQFVIRDKNEAIYIEKVETDQPVRLYTAKGRRAPLYAGASCQVLLAYLPDEAINNIINRPLKKYTENTPVSQEIIWEKIRFIRANHYAVSKGELCAGSIEIAIPVFNHEGNVIASLSTAGPLTRMPDSMIDFFLGHLRRYAELISAQIGSITGFPY